jgi:hypothetical protein
VSETVRTRLRGLALLALAGALVTALVSAVAGSFAGPSCGTGEDGLRAMVECRSLIHSLSLRMGLLAGVGTVLAVLTVMGLQRMAAQDEVDRRVRRLEAVREDR